MLCNDLLYEIIQHLHFKHTISLKSTCRQYNQCISTQMIKDIILKTFKTNHDKYVIDQFTYENFCINGIDGLDLLKLYHPVNTAFIFVNSAYLLKKTFKLKCINRLTFLLNSGVDTNALITYKKNFDKRTLSPLHYLIKKQYGFKSYFFDWAIEQLLIFGANPNYIVNNIQFDILFEYTVLDKVIEHKKMRYLIPMLLNYGAQSKMYKDKKIKKK